jgi:hypothetical protein
MNSGPESCTGIGVVAGLFVILFIPSALTIIDPPSLIGIDPLT